jgi:hypothetical protein
MNLKTLLLTFDIPLLPHQIPMWRGAIAEHAGWGEDAFHNHAGAKEKVYYRYPLVQYRAQEGKAALFALGEGVEAVQNMLLASGGTLMMGREAYRLRIEQLTTKETPLSMSPQMRPYYLKNWLALNDHNYRAWEKMPTLTERVQQLEQILASNIISFAKGIKWQLPQRLEVALQNIQQTHKVKYHGVDLVAFDVSFTANIDLPEGLGLGKACSHGFGVVMPLLENKTKKMRPRLVKMPLQV